MKSRAQFRISWGILLLFAPLKPARAQSAALPAAAGPYRIAGAVVNAITGDSVPDATITLLAEEDRRTVAATESGDDGHFAVEHLPAAKFPLRASKRGYCTSFYDEHDGGFSTAIVTGAGQETGNLVFKLMPEAVLNGMVTADGGDPVEGATVMLFAKPRSHDPGARIRSAGTAITDDTGAYEFANLQAGAYLLAVRAQPWYTTGRFSTHFDRPPETEQQAALDVAYPLTFFDSTTDESSATPILLTAGSRQQANISLHAVPALHIEVQAPRKPDGSIAQPDLRQTIFGLDRAGDNQIMSRGRDGRVEFGGVAPGQYELTQGDPPRVMELNAAASQQVDPDAGSPAVEVMVNLRDAMGRPFRGARSAILEPAGGSGLRPVGASIAGNGQAFIFQSVPPGMWTLNISGRSDPVTVMSVTAGGQTQSGKPVTVHDQPLSVMVTVSTSTARVEGFARRPAAPASGFAGAMVVLVPKNLAAMETLARRDQSDSDGSFALYNVAPGDYTIVAIADGWNLDWANPAVIARYLPGGEAVTVKDEIDKGPGKAIQLPGPVAVQAR